jgi:hypothetical protein
LWGELQATHKNPVKSEDLVKRIRQAADAFRHRHYPPHDYAARKVDQYAAQKVSHLEGGSFYADLLRQQGNLTPPFVL